MLTIPLQSNTSHARPAGAPTRSSTRVRTVCTSSPATPAARGAPSLPSRRVSVAKSAGERSHRLKDPLSSGDGGQLLLLYFGCFALARFLSRYFNKHVCMYVCGWEMTGSVDAM